ncbi:purine-nucleoside phosphorylase [bacterium]|nr:purine-nucleoside phosphorylase [bacterium]
MSPLHERIAEAVAYVRTKSSLVPEYAIVLGSGFDKFGDELTDAVAVPYGEIPGFAVSTAPGHKGELILGKLEGKNVVVMRGRVHLYEGYTPQQVVFPVQVMRALGAKRMIISNASGAIRNDLALGELMIIKDHINMTGCNPCVGPNDDKVGPRFFPVSSAYDNDMRCAALRTAAREGFKLSEGIYVGMRGPSYETLAENRMLSAWGGDAVGMSTVLEIIEAAHCGMSVFGVTCVTDVLNDEDSEDMEQAVIQAGERACQRFVKLVRGILRDSK